MPSSAFRSTNTSCGVSADYSWGSRILLWQEHNNSVRFRWSWTLLVLDFIHPRGLYCNSHCNRFRSPNPPKIKCGRFWGVDGRVMIWRFRVCVLTGFLQDFHVIRNEEDIISTFVIFKRKILQPMTSYLWVYLPRDLTFWPTYRSGIFVRVRIVTPFRVPVQERRVMRSRFSCLEG